nr:MAG: capsid protein [Cressdnaviricota sp.]
MSCAVCSLPLYGNYGSTCTCNYSSVDPYKRHLRAGTSRNDYKFAMKRKAGTPEYHGLRKNNYMVRKIPYSGPQFSAAKYAQTGNAIVASNWVGNQSRANRRHEIKFVDIPSTSLTNALSTAPPIAQPLFFPVQGAAAFNRVGQKVILKSLRLRGTIKPILTGLQCIGRVLVVYDRQANAALPAWTDVIAGVSSPGAQTNSVYDGLNMANRERFVVLMDEQLNIPSQTFTAGVQTNESYPIEKNPSMFNFDRFVKLKDMETHFNNTNGGTFADIQTGSLNLFFATDVGSTSAAWQFTYGARVRYDDI